MTETKLASSSLSLKYKALIESAPDVEIITPDDLERGITPSGKKFEVEFVLMKKIPPSEHKQTIRAWTAMEDTGGDIVPELIPNGLNKGYYRVPLSIYRLNDPQYFNQIREGLIFDSKQSGKVLVAYHFNKGQKRRDDLLFKILGEKSIAFLDNPDYKLPQLSGEEAIQEAGMVLKRSSQLGPAAQESLDNPQEEAEVVKITAIFLDYEEGLELPEGSSQATVEAVDQFVRSLPTQNSTFSSLDQAVASFTKGS